MEVPAAGVMRAVSVGNVNVDFLAYVDELPRAGGRVEARALERRPGGAASNFAAAAAKLGARAMIFGCVGDDWEGAWVLGELERIGVDTSLIERVSAPTGVALITVDARGERTMIVHRGANALLRHALGRKSIPPADWVHAASVDPEVAEESLRVARSAGARTSYDPGGTVVGWGFRRLERALRWVDVLFLNEAEASVLASGGGGAELERVRELVPVVVVKMGPRGALAYVGGAPLRAEAFEVEVVDTTGAGDAFDAAFALASWRGLSWLDALTFANACAALKVAKRGAQASPTLAEAAGFLEARGHRQLASMLRATSESFNR